MHVDYSSRYPCHIPIPTGKVAMESLYSGDLPTPKPTPKSKRVRTGCLTCRDRHLKCDESVPACRNCEKGGRKCIRGIRLNFSNITIHDSAYFVPFGPCNCMSYSKMIPGVLPQSMKEDQADMQIRRIANMLTTKWRSKRSSQVQIQGPPTMFSKGMYGTSIYHRKAQIQREAYIATV
ncbi:hypothetical protein Trisim1_006727 [Trichoderma cf. simile WF8]